MYLKAAQLPRVLSEKIIKQYHAILEKNPSEEEIFEFYSKIKIPDGLKSNPDYNRIADSVLFRIAQKKLLAQENPFDDFFDDVLIHTFTEDELKNVSSEFQVFVIDGSKYDLNNSVVKSFLCKLEKFGEKDLNYYGVPRIFKNLHSLVLLNDQNLFGVEFYGLLMRCWQVRPIVYRLPAIKDCTFNNTIRIAAIICENMPSSIMERQVYEKLFQRLWSNNQELTIDRAIWSNTLDALENTEIVRPVPRPDPNVIRMVRGEQCLGVTIDKAILHKTLLFLERQRNLFLAEKPFEETLQIIRDTLPGLVVYQPVKITIKQEEIVGDVGGYLPLLKQIFPNGKIIVQES